MKYFFAIMSMTYLALASGCSTKTKFIYEHPQAENLNAPSSGYVAIIKQVQDMRTSGKNIDKMYSINPLIELQQIIEEEVMTTGLFERAIRATNTSSVDLVTPLSAGKGNNELIISAGLIKMEAEPSSYQGAGFVPPAPGGGFIEGFVAGLIVEVAGHIANEMDPIKTNESHLRIRVENKGDGEIILDKVYNKNVDKKEAKSVSGSRFSRAKIIGKVIKKVMNEFKVDLMEALNPS